MAGWERELRSAGLECMQQLAQPAMTRPGSCGGPGCRTWPPQCLWTVSTLLLLREWEYGIHACEPQALFACPGHTGIATRLFSALFYLRRRVS